jgi:hypothetical protein
MGRMKLKIGISLIAVTILNVILFQNCGGDTLKPVDHLGQKLDSGTGQPYDGKIYVVAGVGCADGTFVQSRIVVDTVTQATVVRENCQDVSRTLGPGDFAFGGNNAEEIRYNNVNFTEEKPWTPIPILSSWYYQLTGTLQLNSALVYDIDLFETSAVQIQSLKQAGHIVICNFSSGTYENWRPDASLFPAMVIGNTVASGEKWVDIRASVVHDLMVQRMDLAQSKGCDGVDLDSADGYSNNSGFAISKTTQILYNRAMAFAAHDRHLIVALKNTADLVADLSESYDFAIAEQCFQYNECDKYLPFTNKGKAILGVEMTSYSSSQCTVARASSISLSFLSPALDGSTYRSCP